MIRLYKNIAKLIIFVPILKLKHKNGHPLKKQNIWKFIIEIAIQTMLSITGGVAGLHHEGQAVTMFSVF